MRIINKEDINLIDKKFSKFINLSLRFLLLFVIVASLISVDIKIDINIIGSIVLILFTIGAFFSVQYLLKRNVAYSKIIIYLYILALIVRISWFWCIDSIPISDFNRMYICANDFLNGDTSMFKGTAYMARFPHMTINVLYFALIQWIFKNPLIAIRLINIFYSMMNVFLIYMVAKEVFNDKYKQVISLFIASLYPPMILYNNVYCSENIAMPLFILSVLVFLKSFKNGVNIKKMMCSAIILSIANLFRPIGYVVITAYILYSIVYFKEKIIKKLQICSAIILSFFIPFAIISYTLIALDITEHPLWHGTEPPTISMLKGTNIESNGRWNEEDSKVFGKFDGDYEKVDAEAKRIIKERLTKTPITKLVKFYVKKYSLQWSSGDFGGTCWSEAGLDEAYNKEDYLKIMGKEDGKILFRPSTQANLYIQVFYITLILLTYFALYKSKNRKNYKMDIFYILFCGFSLQCLITESQDRYTYIVSWLFIIFAAEMLENEPIKEREGTIMDKLKNIIKLLRPKQWIKNFFVFGAILFSNNILNLDLLTVNIVTFIAFCLASSTIYVLNDIVDVENDKNHPKKCKRPIASGKISISKAKQIGIMLCIIALILSFCVNYKVGAIVIVYFINNLLYSFKVKQIVLLDVLSISIGFILRVLAGGLAIGVTTSSWIILCTLFLSLFLGFGKRRNEILVLGEESISHRKNLSQYTEKLLDQLINVVLACTIVFYSIYCVVASNSGEFVWTTILVVFGILRYYYLMYSKCEGGNPAELILCDRQLRGCIALWICACITILNI